MNFPSLNSARSTLAYDIFYKSACGTCAEHLGMRGVSAPSPDARLAYILALITLATFFLVEVRKANRSVAPQPSKLSRLF